MFQTDARRTGTDHQQGPWRRTASCATSTPPTCEPKTSGLLAFSNQDKCPVVNVGVELSRRCRSDFCRATNSTDGLTNPRYGHSNATVSKGSNDLLTIELSPQRRSKMSDQENRNPQHSDSQKSSWGKKPETSRIPQCNRRSDRTAEESATGTREARSSEQKAGLGYCGLEGPLGAMPQRLFMRRRKFVSP
jgi:hypothetical protein